MIIQCQQILVFVHILNINIDSFTKNDRLLNNDFAFQQNIIKMIKMSCCRSDLLTYHRKQLSDHSQNFISRLLPLTANAPT